MNPRADDVVAWISSSIRTAAWAPVAVLVAHIVLATAFSVYVRHPEFDSPMHALGGVAIGYFFWRSVTTAAAVPALGRLTDLGRAVLAFGLVCAAAVGWEFFEWTLDSLALTHVQTDLHDTMLDLLLGVAGGGLTVVASWLARRLVSPASAAGT